MKFVAGVVVGAVAWAVVELWLSYRQDDRVVRPRLNRGRAPTFRPEVGSSVLLGRGARAH